MANELPAKEARQDKQAVCFYLGGLPWRDVLQGKLLIFYNSWGLAVAKLVGQIEGKNLLYRGTIPFCLHIVP